MRWSNGWMVMAGVMIAPAGIATAEDITLTTYYPSPRGVYRQLRVGDATGAAGTSALHVVQSLAAPAFRVDDVLGDSSPFIIMPTGQVGIGALNPGAAPVYTPTNAIKLDVAGGHIRIASGQAGANSFIGRPFLELDHPGGGAPIDLGGGIAWQRAGVRRMELLYGNADDALFIWDDITGAPSGTPRVTFERTGNVGIGTTTPANKLQIVGGGAGTVDLRVNGRIRTGDAANNGGVWLGDGSDGFVGENGNNIGFYTANDGWNAFQISRVTGNVGIGTTAPGAKLHIKSEAGVVGNIWLGDINEDMAFDGGNDSYFPFVHKGAATGFTAFAYQNSGQRLLTIENDGDVFVTGKLHVGGHRLYLEGPDGVNMAWIMGRGGQEESGVGNLGDNIIGWTQNGTIMGRTIRMLGHVEVGGPPYPTGLEVYGPITNPSDIRLKTNIVPLSGVLERLNQLRGVSYQLKHDEHLLPAEAARRQLGFIAQEMEGAFPELVYTNNEGIMSIDYVKFVPVLLEAVKELKAENDQLKQRVEALERRAP